MKILEKINGFYTEFKRLGDNMERIALVLETVHAEEIRRIKEYAEWEAARSVLAKMQIPDLVRFKSWIKAGLERNGFVARNGLSQVFLNRFLDGYSTDFPVNEQNTIITTLGYKDFTDLVDDWRKREEGTA